MPPSRRVTPARIARFRVHLNGIQPEIWRTFEIDAGGTFWDLHVAIQDTFGWQDSHLHRFEAGGAKSGTILQIGLPSIDEFEEGDLALDWEVALSKVFTRAGKRVDYRYDFGDDWEHVVVLEAIEPADADAKYPRCVGGERAGPPDDCGGVGGYEELVEALADPRHERHAELREWAPRGYDPARFDPASVVFHDPIRRLKDVLRGFESPI